MGIARAGRPVVCADPDPPARIAARAAELGAPLWQLGRDFQADVASADRWDWKGTQGDCLAGLPRPAWLPDAALGNAAGAVMAVRGAHPGFRLGEQAVREGLATARLAGRQQPVRHQGRDWLLDVGHNPAAIALLAERLAARRAHGRVRIAFALMARKALGPILAMLAPVVDEWFILTLDDPESHPPEAVRSALVEHGAEIVGEGDAARAIATLMARATTNDLAVAAGSFRVVEAFMRQGVGACNMAGSDRN